MSRPRRATLTALAIVLALLGAGCSSESPGPADAATPAPGAATAEWTAYGGDALGARFSPLAEVTRDNVTSMVVAWTFRTGETPQAAPTRRPTAFEATPILVDGTLYLSTPLGKVFALDPATGTERWRFDAQVNPQTPFGDFTSRGVSAWLDPGAAEGAPCRRRIFLAAMDARLIALDARTGRTCADFGEQGTVNLRTGLHNPPQSDGEYGITSPPAVVNGVVVIGSSVSDNGRTDLASGEIRAFDARTGALRWSWDPIPRTASDPAWTTWNGPVAHATGAANAWAPIAADVERDLVVIPTSSPSPDYYGGERLGANLYANSIVALRASTGARVWHFQVVHHDLWDYDVQAQPSLVVVRRDGREIPAVVQATKTGQLFVLHRETGVPIFPVQERPVPARAVAGETVSPTQPFSSLPSFGLQHLSPDDAWGLTPLDRRRCREAIDGAHYDGVFTPPGLDVTLVTPSNIGGAHWGGVAFDPARQIVVVPVNRLAALVQLIPRERHDPSRNEAGWEYAPMRGTPYVMRRRILLSPLGLPCTPPPFGTLVAISLLTGKTIWEVPLGTTRDLVASKIFLPITVGSGTPNLGGPIITAGGLIFIGAAMDNYLRAFDVESGRELWKGRLPAGGQATPMTYRLPNGRQYVVIAAGGHGKMGTTRGDSVVAFALPSR
ncbi:MAG TPA: pyrroloquinoline quinone-dependent dehydrogenase [Patescibacteria group bacterium]|nr:pyrroloquinoline quinone-dependent dehydrogenase [Patescibacteria group bacterium]